MTTSETNEPGFLPRRIGQVQGGGYGARVYDPTRNPLPTITRKFDRHTGHNGGQFILDRLGVRRLTCVEMAKAHNFTDRAIAQLERGDLSKQQQQHYIGNVSFGVATLTALYRQVQDVLDAAYLRPMGPSKAEMPVAVHVSAIALAALLPSFVEMRQAQRLTSDLCERHGVLLHSYATGTTFY